VPEPLRAPALFFMLCFNRVLRSSLHADDVPK
jgi:hypothetical protein